VAKSCIKKKESVSMNKIENNVSKNFIKGLPSQLAPLTLKNLIGMAPMTRSMATDALVQFVNEAEINCKKGVRTISVD